MPLYRSYSKPILNNDIDTVLNKFHQNFENMTSRSCRSTEILRKASSEHRKAEKLAFSLRDQTRLKTHLKYKSTFGRMLNMGNYKPVVQNEIILKLTEAKDDKQTKELFTPYMPPIISSLIPKHEAKR